MSGHGRPRRRGVRLTAICFGVATCAVTIALAATAPAPAATDPFDAVLAHDFTFAAARLDAAARAIGSARYPTPTPPTGGWERRRARSARPATRRPPRRRAAGTRRRRATGAAGSSPARCG